MDLSLYFHLNKWVYQKRRTARTLISLVLILSILFISAAQTSPALAAPILTITPITWNVVGLDSNNVNVGPNNFPVGARVCNTGPDAATNLTATFVWDSVNAFINLRSGSLNPITSPSLAPGACDDFYFEVTVTRSAAAYDTARRYHIEVTADNVLGTLSTPTPREIFVERLVSQNRNSITDVLLDGVSIPAGGTMNLLVGNTYTIQLVGATATNGYEQIESFINFPNTIFQILNVSATYSAFPTPGTDPNANSKLYADGCGWVNDPTSPAYRSCTGTGKYGGNLTITYTVKIIGGGGTNNTLNSLVYDFSGSSYHYNDDYSTSARIASITDPSLCTRVPIATWNFNNNTTPTPAGSGTFSASTVTQTVYSNQTGNSNNPAVGYTNWAAAFSAANYLQFAVGTQGYYSITFRFGANRASTSSPTTARVAYSTDGTAFTNVAPDLTLSTTWNEFSPLDLSAVTAINDNTSAAFRIYAFGGAGGNQANRAVNFDTVTVSGCELPRSISLSKTPSTLTYNAIGQTVTYTYTLINTGLATLTAPYAVTDDRITPVSCASATSPLLPGASTTCNASYTITQVDLDAGSIMNTASATATIGGTTITSNDANATITAVQNPALTIVKTATPATYTAVGQIVSYSFLVTNSGNITLTGPFTVSDDKAVNEDCPATASLAPGASITCSASYIVTQADMDAGSVTNIASVSNGTVTSPTDSETVTAVQNPSLSIIKTATPLTYTALGQVINYSFLVTNSGNVTLAGPFTVSDDRAADEACPATASLAPGDSITCSASYIIIQADLNSGLVTNTASASNGTVTSPTDSETVTAVQNPSLTIVKTTTPATYTAIGQVISYSFLVTNSGNVTLSGPFTISDDRAADETCPATASLAPGGSITCTASYTITQADLNTGSVTNTASVSNGTVTSPTDSETVTAVQNPALTIVKTANPTTYANVGEVINYTLIVTNTGNVTLFNVRIADPVLGALTCAQPVDLAPGGTLQCAGSHTITPADITNGMLQNTATASGSDPQGGPVSQSDTAIVNYVNAMADLSLVKSVDNPTPSFGSNVIFSVVLTNSGPANATNIQVSDALPNGFTFIAASPSQGTYNTATGAWNVGNLAVNASATLTITAQVNVSGSYANTAQVSAVDQADPDSAPNNGNPAEDDQSSVTIVPAQNNPSQITKSVVSTSASHTIDPDVTIGEVLTYQVVVTIPPGVFTSASLVDTMDRGLAFVDCLLITSPSSYLTTDVPGGFTTGICQDTTGTQLVVDDPIGAADPRDAGRRVRYNLGTLTNSSGSDQTLMIIYRVVILDSQGNSQGIMLANRAVFSWTGNSLEAISPSVVIREPDLAISKSADSAIAGPGTILTFTLRISHTAASRGNAYDTEINDPLPAELEFIDGSLNCVTGDQDPNVSCTYVAATRTIHARWSNFALRGGEGIIRFSARVASVPASGQIVNTAAVQWTSLPGTPPGYDGAHPGVQSPYNPLSTERFFDPTRPFSSDVYGTSTTLTVNLFTAELPSTGFAPRRVTDISALPQNVFDPASDLVLEIPALSVKLPVVGVPLKKGTWDLTWLGNQAGWLEGSAYPTWNGNSLVTAHVYGADGLPGPFFGLSKLKWGNQVLIHAYKQTYIYEVRSVRYLEPDDFSILHHEERSWLTLLTCKGFNEKKGIYDYRVAVKAVLIRVVPEP